MILHDIVVIEGQMSRATLFDHWSPPEPEPPLIIKDEKYTNEPTTDSNILSQCILELAQTTRVALDLDFDQNNRYCRRIRLDNLNDRGEREELQVLLPYEAFCWNSYDTEDIVILMLEGIRKVNYQNIVWYQVRALLDDFMDPLVYRFIEVLEKSESADDIDFAKVEKKFRRAQLINGQNPQPQQIQKPTPAELPTPPTVSSELPRPTKTSVIDQAPQVINLADDDDDCIIIN